MNSPAPGTRVISRDILARILARLAGASSSRDQVRSAEQIPF